MNRISITIADQDYFTFVLMKISSGSRIILILIVLSVSSFDRHLVSFFPGEMKALLTAENMPSHGDVPAKYCDHHEDIAIRSFSCPVPQPCEQAVQKTIFLPPSFVRELPHTIWQPPEHRF
jgi:hypothetical protein